MTDNQRLLSQFYTHMAEKQTSAEAFKYKVKTRVGARWLSGRLLDSRPKGRWFEPHRCHCLVVLEQDWFNPGRPVLV